jgi:hypothetical protein
LGSSQASTKEVVTRTFTEAMDALSANMQHLALEAEVSISDLNELEEHLKAIHKVVSHGDSSITAARDELLAELWTILGGNRKQLNRMDKHLALLKGLGGYRHRAYARVVAALQVLESTAEEMEELRERVAAPELAGDAIPVDVQMKGIRSGVDRLKELRIGAKQLEEQLRNRVLGSGDGSWDHSQLICQHQPAETLCHNPITKGREECGWFCLAASLATLAVSLVASLAINVLHVVLYLIKGLIRLWLRSL